MDIDIGKIEAGWQKRWEGAFVPTADHRRKKFYVIFAYPGISGYLHVGHMRSYTYPDVIARYKRMTGYNVLFPAGFHASGLPAVGVAKRMQRGDQSWLNYLRSNGCPEDVMPKLSDPVFVVKYFSQNYLEQWQRIGLSLDRTRVASTIDPEYNAFIKWQFAKLNEAGLLVQKTHYAPACPNCGPVAIDPSETDVSSGGNAEMLQYTVIKFRMGDIVLPCATLRAETVYGVTNIWLNPDVEYVEVQVDGETWLLAKEAIGKLKRQGLKIGHPKAIPTYSLLGKSVRNPATSKELPILPGKFVSASQGTGVVMSVPAHAPYDLAALKDLSKEDGKFAEMAKRIAPIPLIKIEGYSDVPAGDLIVRLGITSASDQAGLDQATQTLYKEEFHKGVLRKDVYGEYGGMKVAEGKDVIIRALMDKGDGAQMYEFSEEVICRCGERVVVRMVPNQWFIAYSNAQVKKKAKTCAERMTIVPDDYKPELAGVIDWYGDRACVRQGAWLGTEFPLEKGWIIEPISDSTLYPAYYIVSKYVNEGKLKTEQMTVEFFDHIYLGKGNASNVSEATGIAKGLLEQIRSDYLYWYALDMNCGGKEHKSVHFPVFVMSHVALLPEEHWPKGIFVNWWIVGEVGKLSKSKGGAESLADAVQKYTADGIRLYYCHIGSPKVDIAWDKEAVLAYRRRIELIYETVMGLIAELGLPRKGKKRMSAWLRSVLNARVIRVRDAMERYDLREASNVIFYEMYNDLRRYLDRGGFGSELKEFLKAWVLLASPFAPHMSEELWHKMSEQVLASLENYPEPKDVSALPIYEEMYLDALRDDLKKILKMYKGEKSRIEIFVSEDWKRDLLKEAIAEPQRFVNVGVAIKTILASGIVPKGHEPRAVEFIKTLQKYAMTLSPEEKAMLDQMDEFALLGEVHADLESEFSCRVIVHAPDETAKNIHPKAGASKPLKPGLLIM